MESRARLVPRAVPDEDIEDTFEGNIRQYFDNMRVKREQMRQRNGKDCQPRDVYESPRRLRQSTANTLPLEDTQRKAGNLHLKPVPATEEPPEASVPHLNALRDSHRNSAS